MPTVIALDTSLSMSVPISKNEETTRLQAAVQGINTLLDYFSTYSKLEFVALIAFSSSYEVLSPFTRDFDLLRNKLNQIEERDMSCIEPVFHCINNLVLGEWGNSTPCQVILFTDGDTDLDDLELLKQKTSPIPFSFPGKLTVLSMSPVDTPNSGLQQVVAIVGRDSSIIKPESPLTIATTQSALKKMAEQNYQSFSGTLKCGNLNCKVILSPVPTAHTKTSDFGSETFTLSGVLEICGFIELVHIGSPAAVSRHLVLPHPGATPPQTAIKLEADSDEESQDEGKIPSFCVLLHGSLKVENMAALCQVGRNWYGVLYSWADSKKKSNLMLTILEPGVNSVAWLGNINYLGVPEDPEQPNPEESFPVRPAEKRSYSQNCVVWIRQAGLQSDIQKILRHARKLPDKTQQFYKELNRVRRAAISLGFISLLDGLAAILERECTLLPGGAHPDCALQLTHAAGVLRKPFSRDPKFNVLPMQTKFADGD